MARPKKDKSMCIGCRQNYYNGNNDRGITECWNYKTAKAVKRFRIGWWTTPTSKDVFTEVITLDCHVSPGNYANYTNYPAHLR